MLEVNYESPTPQVSNANILEKHFVVPQNIWAPLSTTETSSQYIIKYSLPFHRQSKNG